LAGSEWVLEENPAKIIRIVLHGFAGPMTVKDQPFNGSMFPFRDLLADDEIAAVLTFIRQEWGNKAPPVKPEDVKAIRAATTDRSAQWSEAELKAVQ
jgi:mono/diheme cytochrome c family protein